MLWFSLIVHCQTVLCRVEGANWWFLNWPPKIVTIADGPYKIHITIHAEMVQNPAKKNHIAINTEMVQNPAWAVLVSQHPQRGSYRKIIQVLVAPHESRAAARGFVIATCCSVLFLISRQFHPCQLVSMDAAELSNGFMWPSFMCPSYVSHMGLFVCLAFWLTRNASNIARFKSAVCETIYLPNVNCGVRLLIS